ncbi:hypothetical protein AHAS_Ahas11G0211200 [Arachis hypogaea]
MKRDLLYTIYIVLRYGSLFLKLINKLLSWLSSGEYDKEEKAARAYDLAALKYWGPTATANFPVSNYPKGLEEMKHVTKQEFIASLRRKSSGFSRGASIYRGVTRHHQQGRWQARIGRVAGNKDLYLGTFGKYFTFIFHCVPVLTKMIIQIAEFHILYADLMLSLNPFLKDNINNNIKKKKKKWAIVKKKRKDFHRVDLTRLLPFMPEKLEEEKSSEKWITSFRLTGLAKGGVMNVSFGYLVVGDNRNVKEGNNNGL